MGDIVVIKKRRANKRRHTALPKPVPAPVPVTAATSKGGKLHYRFQIRWTKDVPKNGQNIWGMDAASPTQAKVALQKVLKKALGREPWTRNIELKPLATHPAKNNG